ncbi:MAG: CatB-related O-acetyltransferase [Panacagrimonas sp.]
MSAEAETPDSRKGVADAAPVGQHAKVTEASNATLHLAGADELLKRGLMVVAGKTIVGTLRYERPAWVFDPRRIKDCTIGAFTLINGLATTSLYRCVIGRYGQIGEGVILGPPEHPQDWFSSHPFTFTRPEELPNMYRLPDFERLAPDGTEAVHYTRTVPAETYIGHEGYVGAGSFVSRGVRIGDGAVVGACSVVTRDVPDYAIAVGSPARVVRLRFADHLVERFIKLQWWRYDLAPFKHQVDFSRAEATLAFFEEKLALGELVELRPDAFELARDGDGFKLTRLVEPLFFA